MGATRFEPGHADAVGLPFPDRVDDLEAPVGDRGAALVGLCAIGVGVYFLVGALNKEPKQAAPPPAPKIVVHTKKGQPKAAQDLGFPEFATKNTTRVAGADPVASAAGVALAAFPSTGGSRAPTRSH